MPRAETEADPHEGVVSRVAEVDGIPISALLRPLKQPRAVILALHGGSATSRYFHHPNLPRLSLLETGAALGFKVLALDRPGYGHSAPFADAMRDPQQRVALTYAAVERLLGADARGAGLFVWAHSAGSELAVRMAADERGADLLGLELAGTGRQLQPAATHILDDTLRSSARLNTADLRKLLWEPAHLYPPEALDGTHSAAPAPEYESEQLARWAPREFADTAASVRVPVHYTLGQHDAVWRNDSAAMAEVAALFSAAPRAVTHVQSRGTHNLSLGLNATAYHLAILSFVEECVVDRDETAASDGGSAT